MGRSDYLWLAAIVLAVAGGAMSLLAWRLRRAHSDAGSARRADILYYASYVLMSLSMFLVALRGLLAANGAAG